MLDQFKTFFGISVVLSYFILTSRTSFFAFEWWMIIVVPLYALFLTAPLLIDRRNKVDIIINYIIWVIVQWVIYYYGLSPSYGPGGVYY